MTRDQFNSEMGRIIRQFNFGRPMDADILQEYYRTLSVFPARVVSLAVDKTIREFRPYGQQAFPSVAFILDIIDDLSRSPYAQERSEDVCQQCDNLGLYLATDGMTARFCPCKYGDKKRAAWKIPAGSDREEYRKAWDECQSDAPLVKVKQEWDDKTGRYESSKDDHDQWCADKRRQIEEMKIRNAKLSDMQRRRAGLIETITRVISREPGEDDAPF